MTLLQFLLAALAVYRVAHMLAMEDGPFSVFIRVRTLLVVRLGDQHWLAIGTACPLCISFWLAALMALAMGWGWLEWLGLAGAALVIHLVLYRR